MTETMSLDFPWEDVAATTPQSRLPLPQAARAGFFLGVRRLFVIAIPRSPSPAAVVPLYAPGLF